MGACSPHNRVLATNRQMTTSARKATLPGKTGTVRKGRGSGEGMDRAGAGGNSPASRTRTRKDGTTGSGLSKERIIAAAIEQIDRNGLMGFSLRDVARSLGVYPSAVYWHVATRDDLLASVVEATMADVAPEPGKTSWQDWLRELFSRCREVIRRHPNVAQLLGGHLVANASLNPGMIDRILTVLVAAGFKDDQIVDMYNVVIATMVGFSTLEFASMPTDDPARWAAQLQEKVSSIPALEFPTLARYLPAMANRSFIVRWQNGTDAAMDSSFSAYVETAIAGMERALARA
ncbi:TetR family transcriptional regulator [Paraburkholderia sp. NMBU_R16]|nr:TetR family transcriptional regulator [Paraburkholderia sp. NMBU_R16]